MKAIIFRDFGRLGGQKRARNLSPERRLEIASRAARARWKKAGKPESLMPSVRFDTPSLEDPAYLEEALAEGGIRDWRMIYEQIWDRPFGDVANALNRVLRSTHHYGITPLWQAILQRLRGAPQ